MALTKTNYKTRLVDKKIDEYLQLFGAVSIEDPKWCGKTWTSYNHINSFINLSNDTERNITILNYDYALDGERPRLIDEWNLVPELWDGVRNKCDESIDKGNYILTCSTKLTDERKKKKIKHSGAGRIGRIFMRTMSLYESGDSTGKVSLMDMYNGIQANTTTEKKK